HERMKFVDRLLTIVVTATLTSAAWILIGSFYIDDIGTDGEAGPAEPSPAPAEVPAAAIEPPDRGESASLVIPVLGVGADQLSDTFGDDRGDGARLHEALDIAAPRGTPVIAAAAGTIGRLFRSAAGGNTIYIRSDDRRTLHYYAHLDAYAPGLEEGQ